MSDKIIDLSVSLFAPVAWNALTGLSALQSVERDPTLAEVAPARPSWASSPKVERDAFIAEFRLRATTPSLTAAHHQGPRISARKNDGWVAGDFFDRHTKTDPLLKPWTELTPDEVSAIELVQCIAVACRKDIALRARAAK